MKGKELILIGSANGKELSRQKEGMCKSSKHVRCLRKGLRRLVWGRSRRYGERVHGVGEKQMMQGRVDHCRDFSLYLERRVAG